jgi:hypothetical protein
MFVLVTIPTHSKQLIYNKQKRKSLHRLYNKLPTQEKLIVDAVYKTSKTQRATTNNVEAQLHKLAGQTTTTELATKLQNAEDAGLIEKRIANVNDEPIVLWKSRSLP